MGTVEVSTSSRNDGNTDVSGSEVIFADLKKHIEHYLKSNKYDCPFDYVGLMWLLKKSIDVKQCSVSVSLHNILLKWWDFMDEDCTAHRNEYTEQEQNELVQRFLSSNYR